jgi:hypothetical protein
VVVVFTEASRGGPSAPGLVRGLGGVVEGGPLGLRQENGGVVVVVVLVGEGRGRGLGSRGGEPSRRGVVEDERRGRRQGGTPDSLRARYRKGFSKWMPGSAAISMYGAKELSDESSAAGRGVPHQQHGDAPAGASHVPAPAVEAPEGGAGRRVEHEDRALGLDVASVRGPPGLLMAGPVPDVEHDRSAAGVEDERVDLHPDRRHVLLLQVRRHRLARQKRALPGAAVAEQKELVLGGASLLGSGARRKNEDEGSEEKE